jgi:hypothetical protein
MLGNGLSTPKMSYRLCAYNIFTASELIAAIVEMQHRNPKFGYLKIAEQMAYTFGLDVDKDVVRRVLAKHYRPDHSGSDGPLYLANWLLRSDVSLKEVLVMLLPSVGMQCRAGRTRFTGIPIWNVPTDRLMNATAGLIGCISQKGKPRQLSVRLLKCQ